MIRSLSLALALGLGCGFALGGFSDAASAGRSLNGTSLDGVARPLRGGGCDEWGCGLNGTSADGVAPREADIRWG